MAFTDRLANAFYIVKTSISFLAKDKSLLLIPIISVLSAVLLFGIATMFLILGQPLAIVLFAIFVFFMIFWSKFLSAALAWMVYEVAKGKNTTVSSGIARASGEITDIALYTIVSIIIGAIAGGLRKRGGIAGDMAGGAISLVVGVAGKLVMPAMIITDRTFFQAVKQLKDAIKTVPEIATYEIGIRPIMGLIMVINALFSIAIASLINVWLGILVFITILVFVSMLASLINQIYYTLLYITLIEKKKVKGLKLKR